MHLRAYNASHFCFSRVKSTGSSVEETGSIIYLLIAELATKESIIQNETT